MLAIVVAFVVIKLNSKPARGQRAANGPTGAALASVVSNVTSVPASTLDTVGNGGGSVTAKPTSISGAALTANGKPEVLYMGAEYCPYCAAERWAMIVALSRFGTFSGLATVHSAAANGAGSAEPYPNTPTWTFVHATYTSQYLTFSPVEEQTNIPDTFDRHLHHPADAHQGPAGAGNQVRRLANGGAAIPFVDFGNKYLISGASYNAGGAVRAQLGHDRGGPEQPEQRGRQGRRRHGQLHHGRDLPADRQPARQRLHRHREVPGKPDLILSSL